MNGIEMIAEERQRQIEAEGYSASHDDKHDGGELSEAAAVYSQAASAIVRGATPEELVDCYTSGFSDVNWPWEDDSLKLSPDPVRNLVKAGALIAAEIDRLLRNPMAIPQQWSDEDLRILQDEYLDFCKDKGFPEKAVVDCQFPDILLCDLRTNLYPQLAEILRRNLQLYGSKK